MIVLDPVDSTAAASLVQQAQSQDVKVIAYDRPIPDTPADFYVSFDNQGIGKAIAESLVDHLKAEGVPEGSGVLQINGSPTDAAAGLIRDGVHAALDAIGLQDARRVRHPRLGAARGAGMDERARSPASARRSSAWSRRTTAPRGGAIAAFKAAGVDPVPPVTGNDATIAALQLIIAGDQYNTISKPSEIVAAAAAKVAVQLLNGETPEATTTLYDTPSQLFVPAVVTAENIKAEIFDAGHHPSRGGLHGRYAEGCAALGIK